MAETKKIIQKLQDTEDAIKAGNNGLAIRLQEEAVEAICDGISSDAWKKYMCNFASNPDQLRRLLGKDPDYNSYNPYSKQTLAYIVGNSTCGVSTATGTGRNIKQAQKNDLDRELDDEVKPIEDCPNAA